MSYASDRVFKLWDYSASHSFLILRSVNNEEDEVTAMTAGFNIDIEFVGVAYLDMPPLLNGVVIREITEKIPDKFTKFESRPGYKVFEIKSDSSYYIVAANYVVGTNNWINGDRIMNPDLKYDMILATS